MKFNYGINHDLREFYLIALAVFFFCAGCSELNRGNTENLKPVNIGITSTYQGEAATYVALDRGIFEDHGLEVTLRKNPSGKTSLRNLYEGEVQIAHVAETPLVYSLLDTSYFPGLSIPPFQIFADKIYSNKIQKVIANRSAGIHEPVDIVGKKIGLVKGTQLDFFFDSFLLEHQISKEEIEMVDLNPTEQVEAIKNGEIDVAVSWEPYATYIQHELGNNAAFLDTDLTYSTLWLSVTLKSFAEANQDILIAYLESLKDAQEYIRQNPDYARQLVSEQTGVPLAVVESLWNEIDYELSLSERMLTLLEDQARWMIRTNVADTTIRNIQQYVHFEPMQKVHPKGITIVR